MADPPSDDGSDTNLDPEIEQLLDESGDESGDEDQPSPDENSADTIEQDVDDESDSPRTPPPDQDIEESTSWVEILDSPDSLSDDDRVVECWGRFWGEVEDLAAAFYLIADPTVDGVETLRLAVYGNPTQLEEFHPRMEAEQFEQRILEYNVQGQAIPKVIYQQVDDGIRDQLSEDGMLDQLVDCLSEQDEEAFKSWFDELVDGIIQEGNFQFQSRAKFTLAPESEDTTDTSTTGDRSTSKDTTNEDRTSDEDADAGGGELDVSIVNSPSKGIPTEELEPDMDIIIRIIDDKVEHLPDELIDDERSSLMSIPLDATVKQVNRITDLPSNISDGDPEDYREIIVELEDMVNGRGLVYLGDRVKLKDEPGDASGDMDEEFVNFLLLLGVLVVIILTIVIMF